MDRNVQIKGAMRGAYSILFFPQMHTDKHRLRDLLISVCIRVHL